MSYFGSVCQRLGKSWESSSIHRFILQSSCSKQILNCCWINSLNQFGQRCFNAGIYLRTEAEPLHVLKLISPPLLPLDKHLTRIRRLSHFILLCSPQSSPIPNPISPRSCLTGWSYMMVLQDRADPWHWLWGRRKVLIEIQANLTERNGLDWTGLDWHDLTWPDMTHSTTLPCIISSLFNRLHCNHQCFSIPQKLNEHSALRIES